MAYVNPTETHHHYVDRGDASSSSGVWAVIAVLIVLFALLFFGSSLFGSRGGSDGTTDVNIRGNIETPSSGTTAQ